MVSGCFGCLWKRVNNHYLLLSINRENSDEPKKSDANHVNWDEHQQQPAAFWEDGESHGFIWHGPRPRMEFGSSWNKVIWPVVWHRAGASGKRGWRAAKVRPGPKWLVIRHAMPCACYGRDGWKRYVSRRCQGQGGGAIKKPSSCS